MADTWDGIHIRMIQQYGWDYVLRYVRAWRNDSTIRALMNVDAGGPDVAQRATFAAAAVSAAVRQDLRARFKAWRFPLNDVLFDQLYPHLLTAMDRPW